MPHYVITCTGDLDNDLDGCDESDAFSTVAEMRKAGWIKVKKDPVNNHKDADMSAWWTHLGCCPECVALRDTANPVEDTVPTLF